MSSHCGPEKKIRYEVVSKLDGRNMDYAFSDHMRYERSLLINLTNAEDVL